MDGGGPLIQAVTSRLGIGQENKQSFLGSEIISSLPLQMSLFYNVYFSPLWLSASILMLVAKHDSLPAYYQFVSPTVFCIMAMMEAVRLYCGYLGNIHERVPELAAFWMVSLVLQLPLCLYTLLNSSALPLPIETSVNIILLMFIVFELFFVTVTIRHMASVQETKFHLLTLEDSET